MKDKQKFEKKLTVEEIQSEINKVGDFFEQVPEDMKAVAADMFVQEIVNWACQDHYQGIGILYEAMNSFRETSKQILAEQAKEAELEHAFENARDYRCLQEMDWMDDPIVKGEVCKIGCVGEDKQYAGGKKYIVFREDGGWTDICQHRFNDHFELVE